MAETRHAMKVARELERLRMCNHGRNKACNDPRHPEAGGNIRERSIKAMTNLSAAIERHRRLTVSLSIRKDWRLVARWQPLTSNNHAHNIVHDDLQSDERQAKAENPPDLAR